MCVHFFPNAYFPTPYSSNLKIHFISSIRNFLYEMYSYKVGLPDRQYRFPPAHGTGLVGAFVVRVLHEPGRRA